MKPNRVAPSASNGLRIKRRNSLGRLAALAMLAACSLTGCTAAGLFAGDCAQWEEQPYEHEVCDTRSETGWCTARHWETRTRSVCVARE